MSYTPQASGVVFAECASKSNRRRLVVNKRTGKRMSIKSKKALTFENAFMTGDWPIEPITGPVQLTVRCYYATNQPDLDPALVMDKLQKHGVIENDRQVVDLHATKHIDPERPRVEWAVRQLPDKWSVKDKWSMKEGGD